VPTSRRRHSLTETDDVAAALNGIRDATGGAVDIPELVKLGAVVKLQELSAARADSQSRRELRRRFAERTLTGDGIDVDALGAAHDRGWARG